MATTLRAVGTPTAATDAVSPLVPGVPAGVISTDISILVVEIKGATAGVAPTITTPSGGWALIGTVTNNGTLVAGTDTGSNTVGMYYLIGTYSAPSITTTGANSAGAAIVAYSSATLTWDTSVLTTQTTTGDDTTSGVNGSLAGGSLTTVADDRLLFGGGISGDIGTMSVQTLVQASATLGATNSRVNQVVTTGLDSRVVFYDGQVTTGAAGIPTASYTNPSVTTAHGRFAVLREGVGAAFSTLTEDFDAGTRDTVKWSAYGQTNSATVINANARLQFTTSTTAGGSGSLTGIRSYALTSSALYWQVADGGTAIATKEAYFQALNSAESDGVLWLFFVSGPTTFARPYKKVASSYTALGTSLTFSAVTHKYLRLSESGGTTSWDYSADGVSWTSHFSVANPVPVTALKVKFIVNNTGAEVSTTTVAIDNINTISITARARVISQAVKRARTY